MNKSDIKTINKGCFGQENQGNLLMTILKGQSLDDNLDDELPDQTVPYRETPTQITKPVLYFGNKIPHLLINCKL